MKSVVIDGYKIEEQASGYYVIVPDNDLAGFSSQFVSKRYQIIIQRDSGGNWTGSDTNRLQFDPSHWVKLIEKAFL